MHLISSSRLSVALAVLLVALASAPALAASTLATLRIDPQPNGAAVVTVQFGGKLPAYSVVGAGTSEPAVIFSDTILGPQVAPTIAGLGPVSNMSLAQTGASSSVALHLTGAAPVRVRAGNGSTLYIDVPAASAAAVQPNPFAQPTPPSTTGLGAVTEVYALKYADVSEIAGVLVQGSNVASNDTFTPQLTNIGTSSLTGTFGGFQGGFQQPVATQTFGGGFGQAQGLAQRLNDNIAIDRRLNAVILTGPADVVAQLRSVIDKLDVPLDSVILETQIVELTDDAARDIGIDFNVGGSVGQAKYTTSVLALPAASANFAVNLFAQIRQGNGKIISRPRILAQSGAPASILTGDAIPIITTVTALSGTGVTGQQVQYVNVGVSLQIQPRVSQDGFVTSHIFSEVSSVVSFNQGIPQIAQRQAQTVATVRDGESFVIGGLLQDNEIKSFTRVPYFSALPIIGVLFRHTTTSHQQTNLYIIVTPHVVGKGRSPAPPAGQPLKR